MKESTDSIIAFDQQSIIYLNNNEDSEIGINMQEIIPVFKNL